MSKLSDRRASQVAELGVGLLAYTAIFSAVMTPVVVITDEPWWAVPILGLSLAATLMTVSVLRDALSKRHRLLPVVVGLSAALIYGWASAGWAWVMAVVGSVLVVRIVWEVAQRVRSP